MIYNTSMAKIIGRINSVSSPQAAEIPTQAKSNSLGIDYWSDKEIPDAYGENLTDLEGIQNEFKLFGEENELLTAGLVTVSRLKSQLESNYPEVCFDILLMLNEQDLHEATVRYWAVRKGHHFVIPSIHEIEKFKQTPILMEQVNYNL